MTEAWYQLSEEERNSLVAGIDVGKVGGRDVLLCNSAWSSEQWQFFGIEEFPDIEAVQKYSQLLEDTGWYRYVDTMSLLGMEWGA
jgi:hypothetical protein